MTAPLLLFTSPLNVAAGPKPSPVEPPTARQDAAEADTAADAGGSAPLYRERDRVSAALLRTCRVCNAVQLEFCHGVLAAHLER